MGARSRQALVLGGTLLFALASGCIIIEPGGGSSGGGGGATFTLGDGGGGGGGTNCTLPSLGGAPVPTVGTSYMSAGAGGTIASGTYELTRIDVSKYSPGPPPAAVPEVLVFDSSGSTFREATLGSDGGVSGVVFSYQTTAGSLIYEGTCGSSSIGADLQYTATPTSLATTDTFLEVTWTYALR